MRKLLLILAVLILLPFKVSWGQDDTRSGTSMLFGVRGDKDGATVTSGGIWGLGGNFYALGYGDVGTGQNSASVEGAYIIEIGGNFKFGLLLGPNSDWEKAATEEVPINYVVVGSGALLSYSLTPGLQVWAAYKRKINPDFLPGVEESQYEAMNIFGLGLAIGFSK